MDPFQSRLVQALRLRGLLTDADEGMELRAREASRRTGLAHSTIRRYLDEPRKRRSSEHTRMLAEGLQVRQAWLETGELPMTADGDRDRQTIDEDDIFAAGERRFREHVADNEPQFLDQVDAFVAAYFRVQASWAEKDRPTTRTAVEDRMVTEFRHWRRGTGMWAELPGKPLVL